MREGCTRLRLVLAHLEDFISKEYWDLFIQQDQASAELFMQEVEADLALALAAVRSRNAETRTTYIKGDIRNEPKPSM
jgi:hypothetical protein